jgi:anti-sigma-K factor RskA
VSATNHADFEALCAAFSLGALDGADREKLRAHLPTCSACRQRVAEFEESSSWLALGLQPIQPSDKVKTAVMQRISGPHGQARPGTGRAPAGPSGPSAGRPGDGASPLVYVALAVAGLALAGAAGMFFLYRQAASQTDAVRAEREQLATERDALRSALATAGSGAETTAKEHRDERARLLAMIDKKTSELENARAELASADLQLQRLALIEKLLRDMNTEIFKKSERTPLLAQGAGRVLWNGQDVVVIADLPPLPLGKTYELWRIEPGAAPRPAGLYSDLDASGGLLATHTLPNAPRKVDAFAISREDTGGAVGDVPTEVLMVISP